MNANWFAALPVNAGTWLEEVLSSLPQSCRPFDPLDLHLTLAFFGPLGADAVARVKVAIMEIGGLPMTVQLAGVRPLPKPNRVSALSFELARGRREMTDFMARWRDPLCEAAGVEPDRRPPLAHITIARPIRGFGAAGQREAVDWAGRVAPPPVILTLDRVALFTWSDDRRRRQFKTCFEKRLDG